MDKDIITEQNNVETNNEEINKTEEKKPLAPHKEYAKRMQSFKNKYLMTLYAAGTAIAIGIGVAIFYEFIIGVAAVALGVVIYIKFVNADLYSLLGFEYKTYAEGLKITKCRARYGDVLWVPSALMSFEVTKIGDKAFDNEHNRELRCVFLPKTLKYIGRDVFSRCEALEDIFFEGSEEDWEKVEKLSDLSAFRITFDAKYPPIKKKKKEKKAKKKN